MVSQYWTHFKKECIRGRHNNRKCLLTDDIKRMMTLAFITHSVRTAAACYCHLAHVKLKYCSIYESSRIREGCTVTPSRSMTKLCWDCQITYNHYLHAVVKEEKHYARDSGQLSGHGAEKHPATLQPRPMYLLCPSKLEIFGIRTEGVAKQVKYLISELQ